MIDVLPLVVTTLKTVGLPVLAEVFLNTTTPMPCITYMEYSNVDTLTGNTVEYSEIITMIKIWSPDLKVLMATAVKVDNVMKPLGFNRDYATPIFVGGLGQYVLRYKAQGYEHK